VCFTIINSSEALSGMEEKFCSKSIPYYRPWSPASQQKSAVLHACFFSILQLTFVFALRLFILHGLVDIALPCDGLSIGRWALELESSLSIFCWWKASERQTNQRRS
jgi:hypothetical protein